jgi:hypothetical protein
MLIPNGGCIPAACGMLARCSTTLAPQRHAEQPMVKSFTPRYSRTLYCMCVGVFSRAHACARLRVFARVCARLHAFDRVCARVCARARGRRHAQRIPHTHAQSHAQHCNAQTCRDMRNDVLHFDCARERRHAKHILRRDVQRHAQLCNVHCFVCVRLCVYARVCVRLRVFGRMRRPSQFNAIGKNQCKETASKVCPERGQREHGPCSMRASAIHRHFCTRIDEARLGGLGIPNFRNKHDEYTNPNTLGVPQTKAHECECMIVSSMRNTSQSHSKQERTTFLIGFCCGRMSFNKCAQLGTQTLQ